MTKHNTSMSCNKYLGILWWTNTIWTWGSHSLSCEYHWSPNQIGKRFICFWNLKHLFSCVAFLCKLNQLLWRWKKCELGDSRAERGSVRCALCILRYLARHKLGILGPTFAKRGEDSYRKLFKPNYGIFNWVGVKFVD